MIWALLAAFLTKRPAWVQAVVVGLCTGLFVAAGAYANLRDPLISSVVLLMLAAAVVAGVGFYLALRARLRHGWAAGAPPRRPGSTSSMPRCGCCP
jgi:4-hydroxybenzoate polyprenyltransferase